MILQKLNQICKKRLQKHDHDAVSSINKKQIKLLKNIISN